MVYYAQDCLCLGDLCCSIDIIEEARQERSYGCARGSMGRCTAGVTCQIRLHDDNHAWRFDHKPPVVATPATSVNATPTPAVVVVDDTRPVCFDTPCDDTSAAHIRDYRHVCADGHGCALLVRHQSLSCSSLHIYICHMMLCVS